MALIRSCISGNVMIPLPFIPILHVPLPDKVNGM